MTFRILLILLLVLHPVLPALASAHTRATDHGLAWSVSPASTQARPTDHCEAPPVSGCCLAPRATCGGTCGCLARQLPPDEDDPIGPMARSAETTPVSLRPFVRPARWGGEATHPAPTIAQHARPASRNAPIRALICAWTT